MSPAVEIKIIGQTRELVQRQSRCTAPCNRSRIRNLIAGKASVRFEVFHTFVFKRGDETDRPRTELHSTARRENFEAILAETTPSRVLTKPFRKRDTHARLRE
jgi:hypothetical protein